MNPCPQDPVLLVHSRLRLEIKTTRNSKSLQTNKFPLAIPKARRSLGRSRHRTRKMPCLQFAQPRRHLPGRIDGQPGSLAMAGPPISPNPHRRHPLLRDLPLPWAAGSACSLVGNGWIRVLKGLESNVKPRMSGQ